MSIAADESKNSRPWYAHGHVWLLIAIPAAALIAGLLTLILAVHGADPVLPHADASSSHPQ